MHCFSCNKEPETVFDNRHYCRGCYCKLIERRIARYLRFSEIIHKNDVLYVADELQLSLIKKIIKGLPVKFVTAKAGGLKEFVVWTLDDQVALFIERFFSDDFKLPETKLSIFRPVRDKELETYAKFRRCSFKPNPKPRIYKYLVELESKYPELFFSISQSIESLNEVLR